MRERHMRKNKAILALIGTSVLLSSCAVSLSRDEAIELLDKIVLRVSEGDFEIPETYSYSSHATYSETHESDVNFSYAKTSKYRYVHCKTITKNVRDDAPTSNGPQKVSETETLDEYYYLDPAAVEKTFITYISKEIDWTYGKSDSPTKEHTKEIIRFEEVVGANALSSWEQVMKEMNGDRYSGDIRAVPDEFDSFLKALYNNRDVYVKDSKYSSLGDGNLDVFLITYTNGKEESRAATFDQHLVRSYDIRNDSIVKTSTYNWNNVKYIYPDLADARSSESSIIA